ncbi:MAG: discoidin domain-containing protein [Myxococcota bacterium]
MTLRRTFPSLALFLLVAACGDAAVEPDGAPIGFVNVRFEEIAPSRAVFRFDTSRPTQCEAHWGFAPDDRPFVALDPDMLEDEYAIDHQIPLEDLPAGTTIYVRALAEDPSGFVDESELYSFTTLPEEDPMDGERMDNVALMDAGARIVEVSSNFGGAANDQTWGIDNAFDGMMSTEWSSYSDGDDAFVTVAFAGAYEIRRFGFRSRKMTDGTSIVRSVRLVFPDGTVMGPFETPDPDEYYEFPITPTTTDRVTLEAVETTGGNTGAKEIRFFALPE